MSFEIFNQLKQLLVFMLIVFGSYSNAQKYHFLDSLDYDQFYSYFDENFSAVLPHGDSNYNFIQLETPVNFFSEKYDHIYINTNGILTFVTEFSEYLNQPFPLEYPSIAAFYSNVDTTGANASSMIVFYKTQNEEKLQKASQLVRYAFTESDDFDASILYVATWENVGYYNRKSDKLNSFQAVIICNDDETYVQLIYRKDGLNWLQADVGELGLSDIRAQAGFMSEDGRYFTLNGSGTDNVRFLNSLSNIGVPGVWLFRVGQLNFNENVQEPNVEAENEPEAPQSCTDGLFKKCHSAAECIDNSRGFCCKCNPGYYGNGFSCIKNTVPLRVTGSISGSINGQQIDERVKIQSYIVMADGRGYTAINPISPDFGHQLKLALPIGSAIGWLFAKPMGDSTNGYQLTGGKLSHFSTLTFKETGEIFQINQTFEGLNYWDQLGLRVEIAGRLPPVAIGSKVQSSDFIEEYQYISETEIRSVSDHKIEIPSENRVIDFRLEQLILFDKCRMDNEVNDLHQPIVQKISKVVLDYNTQEQAVRIGLLAKVGVDPQGNPCTDGTSRCGYNSICRPTGPDTYECDCENGYTLDVTSADIEHCVDIDECRTGSNICDANAYCQNMAGGYTCTCYEGYEGNGFACEQTNGGITNHNNNNNNREVENNHSWDNWDHTTENRVDDECRCSPYGVCVDNKCQCLEGYIGDGHYCEQCKPDQRWEDGQCIQTYAIYGPPEIPPLCDAREECSCPSGYEYIIEENACRFVGYGEEFGEERDNERSLSCDVDYNCHINATCEWSETYLQYVCVCTRGSIGDGVKVCRQIEMSCTTNPEICHEYATCEYSLNLGRSVCICLKGYEGDGFRCQLAPECSEDIECSTNAFCDNGICVCLNGYERDISDFCVPAGKCGGAYCAENALCKLEPEQNIQYCECMAGFQGDGLVSCKSVPPPCHIVNNCGLYASCVRNQHDASQYECVCNTGYYGDGYVCIEQPNCRNTPSLCDKRATCEPTESGLICVCPEGFLGNGTVCKEIAAHEFGFLLISQGVVIIRVPFNSKNGRPISVASMAIGLDKDCVEGRVYWGDIAAKKIMSAKYDGTDSKPFITENLESPEGIAVDWVSRRLYWTDSTKDTIEVASLDNPMQRAVIINKYLVNPRGIAVDPFKEKLFWSDWNRQAPKIEMANLDGTEREIIALKPELSLPNSLVVLPNSDELCYADAGSHKIQCLNIFGQGSRTIANNLTYPFGLANTDDSFYWTDWNTKQIESIDIQGVRKQGMKVSVFGSHKMYGMTAITDYCPLAYSPCKVNNGGCPDNRLCLANMRAPSSKNCKCTKLSKMCDTEHLDF